MQKGKIAKKMDQGYGFIKVEGQEKDLFFHSKDLSGVSFDDLQEGAEVTFEPSQGEKGPQATNVSLASDAAAVATDGGAATDTEAAA